MKKLLLSLIFLPLFTYAQVIVTCAGGGTAGLGDGGPATAAELDPYGVALDDSGNLYICDTYNNRIRKVSPAYGGTITTFAGTGMSGPSGAGYSGDGGPAIYAQLAGPINIATDHHGNVFFVDGNQCIRKVNAAGIITTIAGTGIHGYNGDGIPATAAQLFGPADLAVDTFGNIYIVDNRNFRIRMVDTAGIIHTIAGTGIDGFSPDGSSADTSKINNPWCIKINNAGVIYFGDSARIRKIDISGIITTVAGNGTSIGFSGDGVPATDAEIEGGGGGISLDTEGNLYIADGGNVRVRKVNLSGGTEGIITTIAGNGIGGFSGDGGPPLLAEFGDPSGLAIDDSGDVYISDQSNGRVRLITKHPLAISNIPGQIQGVSLYPNPCSDECTVLYKSPINEQVHITIANMLGQKIKEQTTTTNTQTPVMLNAPPGMYILSAAAPSGILYGKINVAK